LCIWELNYWGPSNRVFRSGKNYTEPLGKAESRWRETDGSGRRLRGRGALPPIPSDTTSLTKVNPSKDIGRALGVGGNRWPDKFTL
jgi:hypothetical protein